MEHLQAVLLFDWNSVPREAGELRNSLPEPRLFPNLWGDKKEQYVAPGVRANHARTPGVSPVNTGIRPEYAVRESQRQYVATQPGSELAEATDRSSP